MQEFTVSVCCRVVRFIFDLIHAVTQTQQLHLLSLPGQTAWFFCFFFLCFILLPTSVLEQAPGSWVVKKRGNIAEVLQVLLALERRGQRLRKTQMIVSDGLSVM